ncbi:MAG: hypothetical protein GX175_09985 [Halanaerobiaceae bacterium]|nr:hypothetical protein [Halanaerobiaceae bacterium]
MSEYVYYYQLIQQCFGTSYFGDIAAELAGLLNFSFQEFTILKESRLVRSKKLFYSDTVIIDGLKIIYPGSAEELYILYSLKEPLAGGEKYKQLSINKPDIIRPISIDFAYSKDICTTGLKWNNFDIRFELMKKRSSQTGGIIGFLAYKEEIPVALIEFICEKNCIYPIPDKRSDFLFINCLYNFPSVLYDYRPFLLREAVSFAAEHGFRGFTAICSLNSVIPNGPVQFFEAMDFKKICLLDRVLTQYYWEDIFLMKYIL